MAEKRFQAVVFDMDGLMFDSEPLYYELVDTVLKTYGKPLAILCFAIVFSSCGQTLNSLGKTSVSQEGKT